LPRVMKHYSPTGRRNHGRPFKRLLDVWDRNGSTSGPTPWQIYEDDDEQCSHDGAPLLRSMSIACHFLKCLQRPSCNVSKYQNPTTAFYPAHSFPTSAVTIGMNDCTTMRLKSEYLISYH
jgi:hypothetical protein